MDNALEVNFHFGCGLIEHVSIRLLMDNALEERPLDPVKLYLKNVSIRLLMDNALEVLPPLPVSRLSLRFNPTFNG